MLAFTTARMTASLGLGGVELKKNRCWYGFQCLGWMTKNIGALLASKVLSSLIPMCNNELYPVVLNDPGGVPVSSATNTWTDLPDGAV